jgi:hypothetical protein
MLMCLRRFRRFILCHLNRLELKIWNREAAKSAKGVNKSARRCLRPTNLDKFPSPQPSPRRGEGDFYFLSHQGRGLR